MNELTDRIVTLDGKIIDEGLHPDEARAHHARLVTEGVPHRWQHWTGEQTLWADVARSDGIDDVHAREVTA